MKKKILNTENRFTQSPLEDQFIRVNLENVSNQIIESDRNIVVNLDEEFNKEREKSTKYKISGKLNFMFKNSFSGSSYYNNLKDTLYLDNNLLFRGFLPYNEFAFIRNDVFKNIPNLINVSGNTVGTYEPEFTIDEPNKHQRILGEDAPYHNWGIYLTYNYSKDYNYKMTYTLSGYTKIEGVNILHFDSGDGLPCTIIDNDNYYKLITPVNHNFSVNDYVIFSKINSLIDTPVPILKIGDENFSSENNVIYINKNDINGYQLPKLTTIKRCKDKNDVINSTSKYFVSILKTITDFKEYELTNLSFDKPIFKNEIKKIKNTFFGRKNVLIEKNRPENLFINFNVDVEINNYRDYNGEIPKKIFLSKIFKNGSGYFDYPLKTGFDFNFHDSWIDDHFIKEESIENALNYDVINKNGFIFKTGTDLVKGSLIWGDFIEENKYDLNEKIISKLNHKLTLRSELFNHNQTVPVLEFEGTSPSNPYGYFYSPHTEITIKVLSSYIETGTNIDNLPPNAKYFEKEGVWKWRDLYENGYIDENGDGVDYPFLNGKHYITFNEVFHLKNEKGFKNKINDINPIDRIKINC